MVRVCIIMLLAAIAAATQFVGLHAGTNETAGAFPGPPFRIQSQASETMPMLVTFELTGGTCDIQVFQGANPLPGKEILSRGTYGRDLHVGESMLLTPGPAAAGTYRVRMGNEPFAAMRQWALAFCVVAVLAVIIDGKGRPPVNRKRMAQLLAVFFLSGQAVGVVHEYSHALVGAMLGGKVERVVWTNLGGEEMRAIFRSLPAAAEPWMSSAAILVPTLLGTAMLLWRYAARGRQSWFGGLVVFGLGASLLCNNFTLLLNPDHMLRLLSHFGMAAGGANLVARVPALYSGAVLVCLVVYQRGLLPSVAVSNSAEPAAAAR
jgi:hypothetical protein